MFCTWIGNRCQFSYVSRLFRRSGKDFQWIITLSVFKQCLGCVTSSLRASTSSSVAITLEPCRCRGSPFPQRELSAAALLQTDGIVRTSVSDSRCFWMHLASPSPPSHPLPVASRYIQDRASSFFVQMWGDAHGPAVELDGIDRLLLESLWWLEGPRWLR